jgi:hypothetical protein
MSWGHADPLTTRRDTEAAFLFVAKAAASSVGHRRVNAPRLGVAAVVCALVAVATVGGAANALIVPSAVDWFPDDTPVVGADVAVVAVLVGAVECVAVDVAANTRKPIAGAWLSCQTGIVVVAFASSDVAPVVATNVSVVAFVIGAAVLFAARAIASPRSAVEVAWLSSSWEVVAPTGLGSVDVQRALVAVVARVLIAAPNHGHQPQRADAHKSEHTTHKPPPCPVIGNVGSPDLVTLYVIHSY